MHERTYRLPNQLVAEVTEYIQACAKHRCIKKNRKKEKEKKKRKKEKAKKEKKERKRKKGIKKKRKKCDDVITKLTKSEPDYHSMKVRCRRQTQNN